MVVECLLREFQGCKSNCATSFQYSQVTFFAALIMYFSPFMCDLTAWFTTWGKFHVFPRFLPLKPLEQGWQHTCFHVFPKTTRILWTWMGYHLWNSHCFPCCRMFKQCNLPNSKKVGSHPVGKDGLWNKNNISQFFIHLSDQWEQNWKWEGTTVSWWPTEM